jgi:hypothetical protein
MKVMGSATLFFEAMVIGLTIPVAIAVYGVPRNQALLVAFGLFFLCIFAIGGIRRDRRTAIITGSLVQVIVLFSSILVPPLIFPGVVFTLIWILAIKLSAKTPA